MFNHIASNLFESCIWIDAELRIPQCRLCNLAIIIFNCNLPSYHQVLSSLLYHLFLPASLLASWCARNRHWHELFRLITSDRTSYLDLLPSHHRPASFPSLTSEFVYLWRYQATVPRLLTRAAVLPSKVTSTIHIYTLGASTIPSISSAGSLKSHQIRLQILSWLLCLACYMSMRIFEYGVKSHRIFDP